MGRYDDIIDHPHYQSKKRRHMAMKDRAAQFSAFAALSGYNEAVEETSRLTSERIKLDESKMEAIDAKLRIINERLSDPPEVRISFFREDDRKTGGAYIDVTGTVRRIDLRMRLLSMDNGETVPIDDITGIEWITPFDDQNL